MIDGAGAEHRRHERQRGGAAVFYQANPANAYNPLQRVKFADGSIWNLAAITAKAFAGTAGADAITGTVNADIISGQGGDDTLYGRAGADALFGEDGNDVLDGGAGNDVLNAGVGNDTYLFGRGSGADSIADVDSTAGHTDVLSIGAGVSIDQLWFRHLGNDLEVGIVGTGDKATVGNRYAGAGNHLEQFRTTDGKVLLDSQVNNLVNAMAGVAPPATGQTTLPADYRTSLAPVLAANWH